MSPTTSDARPSESPSSPADAQDYRALITEVQSVIERIEPAAEPDETLRVIAATIISQLGVLLGVTGGRIYRRSGPDYVLVETFGEAKKVGPGARLPGDYPSVMTCRTQGTVFVAADDPSLDPELEARFGNREFAALEAGDEQVLLSFDLTGGQPPEEVLFSLGLLRHAISQKMRHERMQEVLREARRIQFSILPRRMPEFGQFDIAGRSDALESVGGDFFDFIPITDKILGVAIADVSGHGLPAALQVRDVYMGLRMGMARDFKIVRTVERLNQIINSSTLTSRFVSMFYGELELDGTFIYVNAGHPPPFHLRADGSMSLLERGGVVLGPVPGATYMRGYLTFEPGDMLVLYTDGVVDTDCDGVHDHSEYGLDRLVEVARRHRGAPAQEIVKAVFEDLENFCGRAEAGDDRTVSVISYPATRA